MEKFPMHHPEAGEGTYATERQFEKVWEPKGWIKGASSAEATPLAKAVPPTPRAGGAAGEPKES